MAVFGTSCAWKMGRNLAVSCRSMGSQGTIRQAGGTFKDREVGEEARYFKKLDSELLKSLRKESVSMHDKMIKIHLECIKEHEESIAKIRELVQQASKLETPELT